MARTGLYIVLQCFQDENDTPEPLTGGSVKMTVKDRTGGVIFELSTDVDGGITIQNTNELLFDVDDSDMDYTPGVYKYTLILTKDGQTKPLHWGPFTITENQN
jgi:hypothetical protein